MSKIPNNLVILEMANNHMGSVDHGMYIIERFSTLIESFPEFNFCFKLQYRNLETFIRRDFVGRMDIKYVKRFEETKLSRKDQKKLVQCIKDNGFFSMCTPFDNESVATILEDQFDFIKVASCSFGDWPLIEEVTTAKLPIVASAGGVKLEVIDDVIAFWQNREVDFIIQHCVGEYPTPHENMNLNQIDFLRNRHPEVRFGFSTHENPDDTELVKMVIAKGAVSLEKHVGCPTRKWPLNAYSSTLEQTKSWLESARSALVACGNKITRYIPSKNETDSLLSLQRGVFAKCNLRIGDELTTENTYFAFPPSDGQLTASEFSKYSQFKLERGFSIDEPLQRSSIKINNSKELLLSYAQMVNDLLVKSAVVVPKKFDLELSYHYGIERFTEVGLSMITLVNRGYCKKILICLPGQKHPEQFHKEKEETFHILSGTLILLLDGKEHVLNAGDIMTIMPEQRHAFVSTEGAIFEEISSTHHICDSYYTDSLIMKNLRRKSHVKWVLNDEYA
jgi:sialic acid synthase SpsE/mannose-6-phosphate isomerase-like protein (cupin superfamily)